MRIGLMSLNIYDANILSELVISRYEYKGLERLIYGIVVNYQTLKQELPQVFVFLETFCDKEIHKYIPWDYQDLILIRMYVVNYFT